MKTPNTHSSQAIIAAILFAIFLVGGALAYSRVEAALPGYNFIPFGGRIEKVNYCCNGIELTIGPPRPGNFIFEWGRSVPYAFYQFYRPGPWALGDAYPGGSCEDIYDECAPHPAKGTIRQIGTSMY